MQNGFSVLALWKPRALCQSVRSRGYSNREQGIFVIDKILQESLQSAFPLIVGHQPDADARPEIGNIVNKSIGWDLIRQI